MESRDSLPPSAPYEIRYCLSWVEGNTSQSNSRTGQGWRVTLKRQGTRNLATKTEVTFCNGSQRGVKSKAERENQRKSQGLDRLWGAVGRGSTGQLLESGLSASWGAEDGSSIKDWEPRRTGTQAGT